MEELGVIYRNKVDILIFDRNDVLDNILIEQFVSVDLIEGENFIEKMKLVFNINTVNRNHEQIIIPSKDQIFNIGRIRIDIHDVLGTVIKRYEIEEVNEYYTIKNHINFGYDGDGNELVYYNIIITKNNI